MLTTVRLPRVFAKTSMRPRYAFSLKRTGFCCSSSEVKTTGARTSSRGRVEPGAYSTAPRNGAVAREVKRTPSLFVSCARDAGAPVRDGVPRVFVFELEGARAGVDVDDDDAVSTKSASATGVGEYERGSTRMRATAKGTGAAFASDASRSIPPDETVTLRAFVARPMRTNGSDLTVKGVGSTRGSATASSGVGVGQASG